MDQSVSLAIRDARPNPFLLSRDDRESALPPVSSESSMPRDAAQSRRLHEPGPVVVGHDPITGKYALDIPGHPTYVDRDITLHFESKESLREFMAIPTDHPFRLVDDPVSEGYDEG